MDKIQLKNQLVDVIHCGKEGCEHLMVNLDVDQLAPGDLITLKQAKVRISNPETTEPICINCEYRTIGRRLADWFLEEDDNDDDFFSSSGSFLGGISAGRGGFGGFGGFGGGGFGGGGASRGF